MKKVRSLSYLGSIAACLLLAGCGGRVLQVTRTKPPGPPTKTLEDCVNSNDPACKLPGMPFYTVGFRCLHTTTWLQPVYAVTMTVTSDVKKGEVLVLSKPITVTKFFGRREIEGACAPGAPCVPAVLAKIQQSSQVAEYQPLLDEFKALPEMDPLTFDTRKIADTTAKESTEAVLASNSVAPERYVDTNVIYYYNTNIPRSGSANAEIDLNEEGIASKTSGQVETKTLATILGVFPISDLIKGAAGLGVKAAPPAEKPYMISLGIQTKVYRHTRSAPMSGKRPPCDPDPNLVGSNGAPYNFAVDDVTAGPAAEPSSDDKKKKTPATSGK